MKSQVIYAVWCKIFYVERDYVAVFAARLKELIGDRPISQIAREVGIPQQTISRYLRCQREISLTYLCRIADYFGEDIDFLLGRKDY